MECVTTVQYTIRFNGVPLDAFQPTQGIHQGDSLSPYLFLFAADGLSKLLNRETQAQRVEGLQMCRRAPEISHLLFADDSLLFFRSIREQAERVKQVLDCYCRSKGQLINTRKCSLFFNSTMVPENMEQVRTCLGVQECSFDTKYLGLPTPEGRMKAEKFQPTEERLAKRCSA